jgi:predicted small lipoprotein YifL
MTRPRLRIAVLAVAFAALAGPAGCGLKGALTLPEKSGNVVIRGQKPTDGSTAAPATPAPTPPPADPDKLPPPELPHSNSNSSSSH